MKIDKEAKENIIVWMVIILFFTIILGTPIWSELTYEERVKKAPKYEVKILYCDQRPPKRVYFHSFSYPKKHDIDSYHQAIPRYRGEVNVCDIQVLSVTK